MTVLVTGAAGFIGMHVAQRLLARGERVLGMDNLNDYYDPTLKRARLAVLAPRPGFSFVPGEHPALHPWRAHAHAQTSLVEGSDPCAVQSCWSNVGGRCRAARISCAAA